MEFEGRGPVCTLACAGQAGGLLGHVPTVALGPLPSVGEGMALGAQPSLSLQKAEGIAAFELFVLGLAEEDEGDVLVLGGSSSGGRLHHDELSASSVWV